MDYIGCNISSIFNNTVIGKKDNINNTYEHIYLNNYIRTILEQSNGLYSSSRKLGLKRIINDLFSDKNAQEYINFEMENNISDNSTYYLSADISLSGNFDNDEEVTCPIQNDEMRMNEYINRVVRARPNNIPGKKAIKIKPPKKIIIKK